MAVKNDWIEIEVVVLTADERAPQVPEDTKKVPLMMWTRGFLMSDNANLGDEVFIKTLCERLITGKLVDTEPRYNHDYGNTVPELLSTGVSVRSELGGTK